MTIRRIVITKCRSSVRSYWSSRANQVRALYRHTDAREGIRELVTEFGKAEDQLTFRNVMFVVLSMKWIHLIATGCEPPRAALIRPFNKFTIGYTTDVPYNEPTFDKHVEVVRTDSGQLYFLENGQLLAASELASELIRLVVAEILPGREQRNIPPIESE